MVTDPRVMFLAGTKVFDRQVLVRGVPAVHLVLPCWVALALEMALDVVLLQVFHMCSGQGNFDA